MIVLVYLIKAACTGGAINSSCCDGMHGDFRMMME